jgi:hypothetical protein
VALSPIYCAGRRRTRHAAGTRTGFGCRFLDPEYQVPTGAEHLQSYQAMPIFGTHRWKSGQGHGRPMCLPINGARHLSTPFRVVDSRYRFVKLDLLDERCRKGDGEFHQSVRVIHAEAALFPVFAWQCACIASISHFVKSTNDIGLSRQGVHRVTPIEKTGGLSTVTVKMSRIRFFKPGNTSRRWKCRPPLVALVETSSYELLQR